MGLNHSPRIVTDGLSMYLDATNVKSYSGSGTSWFDLGPNQLIFSSLGTQTPFETIGGVKSFAFNNSGYWECSTNASSVDFGGDCTLLMWIYSEDIINRKTVFEKAGTVYQSYEQEIAVTWEVAENFSWYSRYNLYDYAATDVIQINKWSLVGIKMSSGKTATARTGFQSINGGSWTAAYSSRSSTALTAAGAIRIGNGYAGPVESGNIGAIICYNRMLTDAEVQQNYINLKGRYGL